VLAWADPTLTRLEDQALVPMFGEHPIELASIDRTRGSTRSPAMRRISGCFARRFPERR
jgi:cytochrome c peroxidase